MVMFPIIGDLFAVIPILLSVHAPSEAALGSNPAAVIFFAVLLLGVLALLVIRRRRDSAQRLDGCAFLFDGADLHLASADGRQLLSTAADGMPARDALANLFAEDCDAILRCFANLTENGHYFTRLATLPNGDLVEIDGRPSGAFAKISIQPGSKTAHALHIAEQQVGKLKTERNLLRDLVDLAPIEVHVTDPAGRVTWANQTYRIAAAPERAASGMLDLPERYVSFEDSNDGTQQLGFGEENDAYWLNVSKENAPDGSTFWFGQDITALVDAEGSLSSFLTTMTETFAHLSVGLAVFDGKRRLTLFNPALTSLLGLDPTKLALRPSLREFFDSLRNQRMVPEQSDFATWRKQVTQMEIGARDGHYHEDWALPSGQIFRVTGRPHVRGGIAFLFEDISGTVSLERRYRSEIKLRQTTLDQITDAAAVFDTAGKLVFANSAFNTLWALFPNVDEDEMDIFQVTRHCQEMCVPTPIFGDLRTFVTGEELRSNWQARIETLDGQKLETRIAPLPDGSTLTVFSDVTATDETVEQMQGWVTNLRSELDSVCTVLDMVSETLEKPLHAAIELLNEGAKTSDPDALHDALVMIRSLSDIVKTADERTSLIPEVGSDTTSDVTGIRALLGQKGLVLKVLDWDDTGHVAEQLVHRIVWGMALAAIGIAEGDNTIAFEKKLRDGQLMLTATIGSGEPEQDWMLENPSTRLLERVLARADGTVSIDTTPDRLFVIISCVFPAPTALRPPGKVLRLASDRS